jgi:hypothetical protein
MIVDIVVFAITIVNWAPGIPILVTTALVFAGVGLVTSALLHPYVANQLGDYADVALLLALAGAGAAIADYTLHDG